MKWIKRRGYSSVAPVGVVWPDSASGSSNVRDVFGPRPFSPHIATLGYDYDFHRGVDFPLNAGDILHSPVHGCVIRLHRTHYGWESGSQPSYWTETDSSGAATFGITQTSILAISGSAIGATSYPQDVARFSNRSERILMCGSLEMRLNLSSAPVTTNGAIGIGMHDPGTLEYISVEYDGKTATSFGRDKAGNLSTNGTTLTTGSQTWLRVRRSGTNISWDVNSNVGGTSGTWTQIALQTSMTFSEQTAPVFVPSLYWRSKSSSAGIESVPVDYVGWYDDPNIGRFGNWVEIGQLDRKFLLMHMRDVFVDTGNVVEAGQPVGAAGKTGFDDRSGVIINPHVHMEYIPNPGFYYSNDDPVCPLRAGVLPRVDISGNLTVGKTLENDPDGVASTVLSISLVRADQDFDIVRCEMTGALLTSLIDFDKRLGLNVDNDIPKVSGTYIVPKRFDETSSAYSCSLFFNIITLGTFTSAKMWDSSGNLVWTG